MSGWRQAYRHGPELFETFARAEDPDGRVAAALRRHGDWGRDRVFEIGCGTGRFSSALADGCAMWIGLEPEAPMLDLARNAYSQRSSMNLIRGRGEALPLDGQAVDAVVATWVMGDLPRRRRAKLVAESERVLRPGGALWLLENAGGCDFAELEESDGPSWAAEEGFQEVETLDSEICFEDDHRALTCLGFLLGARAWGKLLRQPRRRFSHRVAILRRPATGSANRS